MCMSITTTTNKGMDMTKEVAGELVNIAAEGFAELLISKGATAENSTPESILKIVSDNWDFICDGMDQAIVIAGNR